MYHICALSIIIEQCYDIDEYWRVCMFYLFLLLCSFSFAFDDVFADIPSQFSGYSYFIGSGVDAQHGELKYKDYVLQGIAVPKIKFVLSYQVENDLWVNGRKIFVSVAGGEKKVYEKASLSTVDVKYPISYGIALSRGFLFNPSSLCSLSIGIGNEHAAYRAGNESIKRNYLFIVAGLDMTIGVLTEWAIEMGVGISASSASDVYFNTVDKFQPLQYASTFKFGMVYHKDSLSA